MQHHARGLRATLRIAALGGLLVPAAVLAQDASDNQNPKIIDDLFECRSIEDDSARLACYDQRVADVAVASETKELVIADREQVEKTKKGLFGFTLPKIGLFSRDDDEEEIRDLETTITQAGRNRAGKFYFTVEGGARWIQTDKVLILGNPGAGDSVTISKAALGSYKAKIGKKRAFKVERID